MKIGELIYTIQSIYNKGSVANETRLRNRLVLSKINSAYAHVIEKEFKERMYDISKWNYFDVPCMEVIESSISECGCYIPDTCIYRTKEKIAKPMEVSGKTFFGQIMTLDGELRFNLVKFESVKYVKSNKYASRIAYERNDYIYFIVKKNMSRFITFSYIPENIVEAIKMKYCSSNKKQQNALCIDIYNEEFPIELKYIERVIDIAINGIRLFFQQKEDKLPDQNNE